MTSQTKYDVHYQGLDERSLAELCSENDRCAQEDLYSRYAVRLFTLCLRYSDNREEARDLVHDAILRALDKISTFTYKGDGSLYAWMSRIAVNMALGQIRRKNRFHFVHLDDSGSAELPEPTDEELAGISNEKLLEIISGLPGTQRAVFNLYCMDGYSHKEIARKLGISERGSTSILAKARYSLRKRINEYISEAEQ